MSKIKPTLTADDKKSIAYTQKCNPIYNYLIKYEGVEFSVGDILIKWTTDYNGHKTMEQVGSYTATPRKYMVVHVDKLGIPYVKKIKADGELGIQLNCVAKFGEDTFQHDPDFVDYCLLRDDGKEYDPNEGLGELRERKKKIRKKNKKLRLNMKDRSLAKQLLQNIKQGTRVWRVPNSPDKPLKEYEYTTGKWKKGIGSWGDDGLELYKRGKKTSYCIDVDQISRDSWSWHNIYLKRPICELEGDI